MKPEEYSIENNRRLVRIESLLDNDSGTGRPGLYQEVQYTKESVKGLSDRLTKVEEAQRFDKWRYSAVGGVVAGVGVWALKGLAKLAGLTF